MLVWREKVPTPNLKMAMQETVRFIILLISFPMFSNGIEVTVNLDHVQSTVEKEFLSVTIGISWEGLNISKPGLLALLTGLSPAYLRLGGIKNNFQIFSDDPNKIYVKTKMNPRLTSYSSAEVDNIVKAARLSGLKLIMDLDLQLRVGVQWDPSNTVKLLQYIVKKKYQDVFNFELGNEPGAYGPRRSEVRLSGTQIGKDFDILHYLLAEFSMSKVTLVGPDLGRITNIMYPQMLNQSGQFLTATTFHQYDIGHTHNKSLFIDPNIAEAVLKYYIIYMKKLLLRTKYPKLPIWIGETADALGGGSAGIGDTYLGNFLWLDKLGISAANGITAVFRQTLLGHFYGLLSWSYKPRPGYWASYVHKQLMGTRALNVTTSSTVYPKVVRIYAQCTRTSAKYKAGSVTVMAINMKNVTKSERLTFAAPLNNQIVDVYLLTPSGTGGVQARQIALNGKTMVLVGGQTLPPLNPVRMSASAGLVLPPLTFAFYVFPQANAKACL